jgi:hypothetical protein
MKAKDRRERILLLWSQRPAGKRTVEAVLAFYGEMALAFPHLLNRYGGDPYQNLVADLKGHVDERKPNSRATW